MSCGGPNRPQSPQWEAECVSFSSLNICRTIALPVLLEGGRQGIPGGLYCSGSRAGGCFNDARVLNASYFFPGTFAIKNPD